MVENKGIENIYSLSPMQEGMLFHTLVDESGNAYFQQASFEIEGELDIDIMQECLGYIISRYDIFRTVFVYENVEVPKQVVLKNREAKILYNDITDLDLQEKSQFIESYKIKDRLKSFDISRDILFRLAVFKTDELEYKVIWSNHHILMDGWCVGVILQEIFKVYRCLKDRTQIKLDCIYPYSNFIKWIRKKNKNAEETYWKEVVCGYDNAATLPVYNRAASQDGYRKKEIVHIIDESLTALLTEAARNNRVTIYNMLQAIWGIILQRYNNTDDVMFGTIVSGRPPEIEHVEKMIGLFINVVPVRVKCKGDLSFAELVHQLQNTSILAEKYSYYPFYKIQQASILKNRLIDHVLVYENFPSWNEENLYGFKMKDFNLYEQTNYDFDIDIKNEGNLKIRINYNRNVYDVEILKGVLCSFEAVIRQVIKNEAILVKDIQILSEAEAQKLKLFSTGKEVGIDKEKTVFQLIEEQVEKTPDKTAIIFGEEHFTYRVINENANKLARMLQGKGICKGDFVSVMLERSPRLVESILGIWKAGGVYIPLDPLHPEERIWSILNNSHSKFLITTKEYKQGWNHNIENLVIDCAACEEEISGQCGRNLNIPVNTNELAYIIYTSGSTGSPKGVMVEHIGMHNHINAKINDLSLDSDCVIAQNASQCFDISVWQTFAALVVGGSTVIYPIEICLDLEKFVKSIEFNKVSILEVVPSYLFSILDYLKFEKKSLEKLEFLIVTGEAVKKNLISGWFQSYPNINIVNAYGPTEASDDITHYIIDRVPDIENVPIGKPIQNMNVYIIDRWMNLCPVGVTGEICVSGIGVGRGYLNDSKKTSLAFVENPFRKDGYERMYLTGDLGRWLPDGNIEFWGRKDYQVKIRGFRIELGEIESRLVHYKNVKDAVVQDFENDNGEKFICAYIVTDYDVDIEEIKLFLAGCLPDYMIPSYFIKLESLPLTVNGKADRKALPKPQMDDNTDSEYQAPTNEIEEIFVAIWEEVLGVKKVGIYDHFFNLGGDSIKAIQITSRLLNYNLIMDIQDFFQYQTIEKLSRRVSKVNQKAEQGIITGEVDLTPIQRWFFEQKFTEQHHWNQAVMLHGKRGFDSTAIEVVFQKLTIQHDALRMVYRIEGDSVVQYNRGAEEEIWKLDVIDLTDKNLYYEKMQEESSRIQGEIDIEYGPLIRLGLFHTKDGDYLLAAIHHLVVDGVSWRILLEDFLVGYKQVINGNDIVFQDKTTSFKEWSKLLNEYAHKINLERYLQYWSEIEAVVVPQLPKDAIVSVRKMMDTEIYQTKLSANDTNVLLREVNDAFRTEINDILLTALGISIHKWSGSNKVLVNLEGHGREDIISGVNLSRTVGWFTTEFPVILAMDYVDELSCQIKTIKEYLHVIPEHGMSYGILKYLSDENRKIKFNLKPEISFNYLGQLDQTMDMELFSMCSVPVGHSISRNSEMKYALEYDAAVVEGKFELSIKYNKKEYSKNTIVYLAEAYIGSVKEIIDYCAKKEVAEYTPTDFGSKDISLEEFESIEELIGNL